MCYQLHACASLVTAVMYLGTPQVYSASLPGYARIIEQSDLVVHGFIRGMSRDEVPAQDLFPADPRPDATMNVILLRLEVRDILKGYYSGANLELAMPEGGVSVRARYNVGNEVILSAIYWKYMRGGSYMVTNDAGCFRKLGDTWWNQVVISPNEALEVAISDIQEAAARCEPEVVFNRADFVAIGTLKEITSHREAGGALVEDIQMRVKDVLKGVLESNLVTFRAVRKNGDELEWKTVVPRFNVGDEWLIFLARVEAGYYVLDGTNGLFRVQGDSLLQADRLHLPLTTSAFVARLRQLGTRH